MPGRLLIIRMTILTLVRLRDSPSSLICGGLRIYRSVHLIPLSLKPQQDPALLPVVMFRTFWKAPDCSVRCYQRDVIKGTGFQQWLIIALPEGRWDLPLIWVARP